MKQQKPKIKVKLGTCTRTPLRYRKSMQGHGDDQVSFLS